MELYISGERIQELCHVYCGITGDFQFNPRIAKQCDLQLNLNNEIPKVWNNPPIVFCYSKRLELFRKWLVNAENSFLLVTHNSDVNMTEKYMDIYEHPKIKAIYSQNVLYNHPKLFCLPIGIANSMWPHGNLSIFHSVKTRNISKMNTIYFYFSIRTNPGKRTLCKQECEKKGLVFGKSEGYFNYLQTLASHKYAICPDGNGIDCHRTWECLYLGVTPIMLENVFSIRLKEKFPCVILKEWSDLDTKSLLDYWEPHQSNNLLDMNFIQMCISSGEKTW